jgi:hypothetical protein
MPLEHLTVAHHVEISFYDNWLHTEIRSTPSNSISNSFLILSSHLCLRLVSGIFSSNMRIFYLSYECNTLPSFETNSVWRRELITKFFNLHSSLASRSSPPYSQTHKCMSSHYCYINKQDRQSTYNVTLRRVRVTISLIIY